jgi:hypothetical protein
MKIRPPLLLAIALVLPLSAVNADVLLLDAIKQAPSNNPEGVSRPARGLNMQQVRNNFGEPINELPWVGEPPITRWQYADFTVYFEHQYVINTVVHR